MQKLGGEVPVVSRFGLVTRTRFGKTKHRVILDNRESGVTAVARKNQRILLPRATDLVFDVLRMQADWAEHSDVALAHEMMGSSRRWCWTSATPSGPSR